MFTNTYPSYPRLFLSFSTILPPSPLSLHSLSLLLLTLLHSLTHPLFLSTYFSSVSSFRSLLFPLHLSIHFYCFDSVSIPILVLPITFCTGHNHLSPPTPYMPNPPLHIRWVRSFKCYQFHPIYLASHQIGFHKRAQAKFWKSIISFLHVLIIFSK